VLFNEDGALAAGSAVDSLAVASVQGAARGIVEALESRGHHAIALAVPNEPRELLDFLGRLECDVVFNQVESLAGDARREAHFAAALELCGRPYTGNGPRALALCLDKPLGRAVLAAHGIPIARGALLRDGSESLAEIAFPVLVKPSREDASHGITLDSVARDERTARARARYVIESYAQPALVEEYIAGREYNVALVEGAETGDPPRVLSVSEIEFSNFPAGAPQIVTYGAKWIEDSPEWKGTRSIDAGNDPSSARLRAIALAAWQALGLSGYARVDLRVEEAPPQRAVVIDVNPNPDISPEAGLALSAIRTGTPYAQLIEDILEFALRRGAARA